VNFLKIIYFHVYNAYYKNGNYKNDIPHLTAYCITATSTGSFVLTLVALVNHRFTGTRMSKEGCVIVYAICLILFYGLFMYKARYADVYTSIKGSVWDTITVKIIVWIVVFLEYASIGLYSYIFNNPK
jgi:hypothetical protein